jgi:hypothetical protein
LPRVEKLRAIAGEPLVREHLRVCWENLSAQGNCSRCEKCIRTRLILADCGELANYPGLEGEESLERDIGTLPLYKNMGLDFFYLLEKRRLKPEIENAIHKLIKRTKRTKSYSRNLAKRTLRKAWSLTGGRNR